MKGSGYWWLGGDDKRLITGRIVAEHDGCVVLRSDDDGTNYPIGWRHVPYSLFNPPHWNARIKADREKWGMR